MGKDDLNDSKMAPVLTYGFLIAVVLGVIAGIFNLEGLGIACGIIITLILVIGFICMVAGIK